MSNNNQHTVILSFPLEVRRLTMAYEKTFFHPGDPKCSTVGCLLSTGNWIIGLTESEPQSESEEVLPKGHMRLLQPSDEEYEGRVAALQLLIDFNGRSFYTAEDILLMANNERDCMIAIAGPLLATLDPDTDAGQETAAEILYQGVLCAINSLKTVFDNKGIPTGEIPAVTKLSVEDIDKIHMDQMMKRSGLGALGDLIAAAMQKGFGGEEEEAVLAEQPAEESQVEGNIT